MDFTPELSAFQGLLISLDNVHPFSKITSKGGNEDRLNFIIESLTNFLVNKQYILDNSINEELMPEIRKIVFYIVLNTDLPILDKMTEMEGIDSVIWTVPALSKFLMSQTLWYLHMDKLIYETISYCYPVLSIEIIKVLIDNIKYFTPHESLSKIRVINLACYRLLCRFDFFKFVNSDVLDTNLTDTCSCFQKSLNFLTDSPHAEELNSLKEVDLSKYHAEVLRTVLQLILECVVYFTSCQEFDPYGYDDIYALSYPEGSVLCYELKYTANESPKKAIQQCLIECNQFLLDKCLEVIKNLDMEIYCTWNNFKENNKTLQQIIGELSYNVREKLLSVNGLSEHKLVNTLKPYLRKPSDYKDLVNDADVNTILELIENSPEDKSLLIQALLHRNDLCYHLSLMELLVENIELLSNNELKQLYRLMVNHEAHDKPDEEDVLKWMASQVFEQCSLATKYELIDEHFTDNCFTDLKLHMHFNKSMTEIFNKFIGSEETDYSSILIPFIQSPRSVYTEIFHLAAESSKHCDLMLEVMKMLNNYSSYYYQPDTEPYVVRVTETVLSEHLTPTETADAECCISNKTLNFIKFVSCLKINKVISASKLLLHIIMPKLEEALIKKNIVNIKIQLDLMEMAYKVEEFIEYRAPMLVMLAQVLDKVRWRINTFAPIAPDTLEKALKLQKSLCDTYGNEGVPDGESIWLKNKLKNMHALNVYHYRKILKSEGDDFFAIVTGGGCLQRNMNIEQLATWLSKVLCLCCRMEWYEIWDCFEAIFGESGTLNLMHDALSILMIAESVNSTTSSWACITTCIENIVMIIKYKFLSTGLDTTKVKSALSRIAATTNLIEIDSLPNVMPLVLPLFLYLFNKSKDYNLDVAKFLRRKLRNSNYSYIFNKILSNGHAENVE